MSPKDDEVAAGHAKGGIARAEALAPEDRSEIARAGAIARWGAKATHKGNFNQELGIDVDCYVLNDATKTSVISQSGMARAMFQLLNDLGARALRMHLGRVLEMCESSPDRETYERKVVNRFRGQQELDLPIPDAPNA